jgi:hypothetical protein
MMLETLALLAALTGEPVAMLEIVAQRESSMNPGAVNYCLTWQERDGRMYCTKTAACYTNCTRPAVWKNRQDLGLMGIRCPVKRKDGKPAAGFSWCVAWGIDPHCLLDPECAMPWWVRIIEKNKSYRPKACGMRGVPDSEFSWLGHWNGCRSREGRIRAYRQLRGRQ